MLKLKSTKIKICSHFNESKFNFAKKKYFSGKKSPRLRIKELNFVKLRPNLDFGRTEAASAESWFWSNRSRTEYFGRSFVRTLILTKNKLPQFWSKLHKFLKCCSKGLRKSERFKKMKSKFCKSYESIAIVIFFLFLQLQKNGQECSTLRQER